MRRTLREAEASDGIKTPVTELSRSPCRSFMIRIMCSQLDLKPMAKSAPDLPVHLSRLDAVPWGWRPLVLMLMCTMTARRRPLASRDLPPHAQWDEADGSSSRLADSRVFSSSFNSPKKESMMPKGEEGSRTVLSSPNGAFVASVGIDAVKLAGAIGCIASISTGACHERMLSTSGRTPSGSSAVSRSSSVSWPAEAEESRARRRSASWSLISFDVRICRRFVSGDTTSITKSVLPALFETRGCLASASISTKSVECALLETSVVPCSGLTSTKSEEGWRTSTAGVAA
jgi:hypothetical protein